MRRGVDQVSGHQKWSPRRKSSPRKDARAIQAQKGPIRQALHLLQTIQQCSLLFAHYVPDRTHFDHCYTGIVLVC